MPPTPRRAVQAGSPPSHWARRRAWAAAWSCPSSKGRSRREWWKQSTRSHRRLCERWQRSQSKIVAVAPAAESAAVSVSQAWVAQHCRAISEWQAADAVPSLGGRHVRRLLSATVRSPRGGARCERFEESVVYTPAAESETPAEAERRRRRHRERECEAMRRLSRGFLRREQTMAAAALERERTAYLRALGALTAGLPVEEGAGDGACDDGACDDEAGDEAGYEAADEVWDGEEGDEAWDGEEGDEEPSGEEPSGEQDAAWEDAGLFDAARLCAALGLAEGADEPARLPAAAPELADFLDALLRRKAVLVDVGVRAGMARIEVERVVALARNRAHFIALGLEREVLPPPRPPATRRRTRSPQQAVRRSARLGAEPGGARELAHGDDTELREYVCVRDPREPALAAASVHAWRALGLAEPLAAALARVGTCVQTRWGTRKLRSGGVEHVRARGRHHERRLAMDGYALVELEATVVGYDAVREASLVRYKGEVGLARERDLADAPAPPPPPPAPVRDPFVPEEAPTPSHLPPPPAIVSPPPPAERGPCAPEDVRAYEAALRDVAGDGALERVLDRDLFAALVCRLGERAPVALALHDECVRRLAAAGRSRRAALKCMGLVGAAVGVVAGLPEAAWADVAIVETSTLRATGAAALFGAPRSQNAFALDYHRGRERSRVALRAGASECSVHGEVTQALTQQLLRALEAGWGGLDLSALSRERLGALVREAWAAAPRARRAAVALAPWLAYYHDHAPSNPLKGTCAEGVFMQNGWDAEQATALLLPLEEMQVVDFCTSYSVRGRSETHQVAALFGVAWDEVVRRNAALTVQFVLAAMDGATVVHTNWDTETYHRHLWWALGGADDARAWRGLPVLALAKPVTSEGYGRGAARLLALGMQLATVVPLFGGGERRVVRTLRLPPRAPEGRVWSRPLATVGGHVGAVVRRAVVREVGEDAATAHRAAVARAFAHLDGATGLAPAAALERLVRGGAQRVARTTPALARTTEHDDASVPGAFEAALSVPLLTLEGNLNCVPELAAAAARAAADLTLRRRLCVFQQATGAPPPSAFECFTIA